MTSLAVTLAVTLVGYRAPAHATPSPPCPVSLALSTPSPSPRGNLLADGTVTMLSLANPPRPRRDHADGDRPQIAASALTVGYLAFSVQP